MSENEEEQKPKSSQDIIKELKDAAALMDAVKELSQDVGENKILNGGKNQTEVKIETTLDGDIVDRASASAQKKAENLKTLLATVIPIFLLLTGGSMEAFGVIDIFSDEEDSPSYMQTVLWDPVDTVRCIIEGVIKECSPNATSELLSSAPSSRFITRMIPMQATVSYLFCIPISNSYNC